jgi:dipeptidyl aminopeptidase/acylaminoacyl peptidase
MSRLVSLLACTVLASCARDTASLRPAASVLPASSASSAASSVSSRAPLRQYPEEVTVQSLKDLPIVGTDLVLGEKLAENAAYTRYAISYKSNGVRVTGIMNVPKGAGPFPLVILNHGYIDPKIYTTGRGLKREQDYLARQGFAVLHTDYRGHAGSDPDPDNRIHGRYYGYAVDALAAIDAVRRNPPTGVDASRAGMLGHSLGGGISLLAAVSHPEMVSALVLYAPISGDAWKNFEKWEGNDRAGELARLILGTRETNPDLWDSMSPSSAYADLTASVRLFHGTGDKDVPYAWSTETEALLKAAGKDASLTTYQNEGHEFSPRWTDFMKQTSAFLKEALKP